MYISPVSHVMCFLFKSASLVLPKGKVGAGPSIPRFLKYWNFLLKNSQAKNSTNVISVKRRDITRVENATSIESYRVRTDVLKYFRLTNRRKLIGSDT